ncbi:DUF6122 family protein [Pontibacter ruber]|uniref:DUF6122 family protein n=1 Tax=Pontibacter ruber TaxID=1343895 RepID=A0ABW5CZ85_9BACT|nr:DUF6122 family protein [Pontibacter ruber]
MLDLAEIFTPRFILHLVLHVAVPLFVAFAFYHRQFKKAFLLLLAGFLIDVDHLLANPIVNPDRCSVGYHFLHSYWLIALYGLLAIYPKTRLIGLGLVIHIVLDGTECLRDTGYFG